MAADYEQAPVCLLQPQRRSVAVSDHFRKNFPFQIHAFVRESKTAYVFRGVSDARSLRWPPTTNKPLFACCNRREGQLPFLTAFEKIFPSQSMHLCVHLKQFMFFGVFLMHAICDGRRLRTSPCLPAATAEKVSCRF